MSEIEKMYENATVKKLLYCDICKAQEHALGLCAETKCEPFYPPFTAEKQLAIFKMFCKRYLSVSQHVEENGDLCFGIVSTVGKSAVSFNKDFEECLAGYVNCLWQDLTEEEKQQVKGILE